MADQTVFVVEAYTDSIRERSMKSVQKDSRILHIFENRGLALDFLQFRAEKRVKDAAHSLYLEEQRLKRCKKLR